MLVTNHVGETFLVVLHKDHGNEYRPEDPIVSFHANSGVHYNGKPGLMSYYRSTFDEIEDGSGLCLDGYDCVKYSLTAENVREVKAYMRQELGEPHPSLL